MNRYDDRRLDDVRKDLAQAIREFTQSGRVRPPPPDPVEDAATLQPSG